jgi:hypothetical protein
VNALVSYQRASKVIKRFYEDGWFLSFFLHVWSVGRMILQVLDVGRMILQVLYVD